MEFLVELFSEIVDFFVNLWTDKIVDKFTSKKKDK